MTKRGRPTVYGDDILDKTREYIAMCEDVVYEVKTRPKIEDGVYKGEEEYSHKKTRLPTIEGLANYLGINKDTIYTWRKDDDKQVFSDLINDLLQKQADMLINNGLTGDYSQVISKVLLTKHGYREGTDVTSNDRTILSDREIEEVSKKIFDGK